jgi:riboflavin kinase/FMN adenylyltransferase
VVTTGTFDGVHVGHRTILDRLKSTAARVNGQSVVVTFHPHPRLVLFPDDNDLRLIDTLEERVELLRGTGIDHLVVLEFTREFSRITSLDYVRNILVSKLGTMKLVMGYDHHFGRNREGTLAHLREFGPVYGFEVEEIPAHDVDAVAVSSTKIRKALAEGDVATAARYLGRPFALAGSVVQGDRLGRTLGFPTANIGHIDPLKIMPRDGVYKVEADVAQGTFRGMLNIGVRPTLGSVEHRVEVHLFHFDADLYGQPIAVRLLNRIRDERQFSDLDQLRTQLMADAEVASA